MIDWQRLKIRSMVKEDLPCVMDIEPRAYTFHWTENIFKDCLERPDQYQLEVLVHHDQIIGYAVYSSVACEAHLLNLAIEPALMGKGLGRYFLEKILTRARELGNQVMFLEVRSSNEIAHRLYLSKGFKEVGMRKGYYPSHFNSREDGRVMALALVEGGL